jgi:hypothetical protein
MMIALSALLAVGTVLAGTIFHTHPWVIVAEAVGSIVALQFTYVAVSLAHHLVHSRRLIPQVQAAIGEQLGVELEASRSLPHELSGLIARLPTPAAALALSRDGDFVNRIFPSNEQFPVCVRSRTQWDRCSEVDLS